MGKSYKRVVRPGEEHYAEPRYSRKHRDSYEEVFKCKHCHRFVCPPASGGHHRNHCPFCLYSRHVDDCKPGDRMSDCCCSMEALGRFQRPIAVGAGSRVQRQRRPAIWATHGVPADRLGLCRGVGVFHRKNLSRDKRQPDGMISSSTMNCRAFR